MDASDELKTRLIKYLDGLEEVGKKGADFVADQSSETIIQFLKWESIDGMSLRDYFAARAMLGALMGEVHAELQDTDLSSDDAMKAVAVGAYKIADAMLAERSKS